MSHASAPLSILAVCLVWAALVGCSFDQSALELRRCDPTAAEPDCEPGFECQPDGYCHTIDVSSDDSIEVCGQTICTTGQACCEEACVDVTRDAAHCGACGAACAEGMTCRDSACVCSSERGDCDADPANGCEVQLTGFDADHCGACGNACPVNMACIAGTCLCQPGRFDCNEDRDQLPTGGSDGCEVDILSKANCGGCGDDRACEADESCEQGRCLCGNGVCVEGESCCGGRCIDTAVSKLHCGACNAPCEGGLVCQDGACVCPGNDHQACAAGESCCPDGCSSGDCTCGGDTCDEATELCCDDVCTLVIDQVDSCGACDNVCLEGQVCADGTCVCGGGGEFCPSAGDDGTGGCVDTGIEEAFCGDCDTACEAGESCCDGACVDTSMDLAQCGACLADGGQQCIPGQLCCDGTCSSLDAARSCGTCDNDCTARPNVREAGCAAGTCVVIACEGGWGDCNGDPADGCEADLDAPPHCGICNRGCSACGFFNACICNGATCAGGGFCDNGTCRCSPGGDSCAFGDDGSHCEGSSCRCGFEGRCGGSSSCVGLFPPSCN